MMRSKSKWRKAIWRQSCGALVTRAPRRDYAHTCETRESLHALSHRNARARTRCRNPICPLRGAHVVLSSTCVNFVYILVYSNFKSKFFNLYYLPI